MYSTSTTYSTATTLCATVMPPTNARRTVTLLPCPKLSNNSRWWRTRLERWLRGWTGGCGLASLGQQTTDSRGTMGSLWAGHIGGPASLTAGPSHRVGRSSRPPRGHGTTTNVGGDGLLFVKRLLAKWPTASKRFSLRPYQNPPATAAGNNSWSTIYTTECKQQSWLGDYCRYSPYNSVTLFDPSKLCSKLC